MPKRSRQCSTLISIESDLDAIFRDRKRRRIGPALIDSTEEAESVQVQDDHANASSEQNRSACIGDWILVSVSQVIQESTVRHPTSSSQLQPSPSPPPPDTLLEQANQLFSTQQWHKSISHFESHLLHYDSSHIDSLYKIGCAYRQLGMYEDAIVYFRRGTALGHIMSCFSLGAVFWKWGNANSQISASHCDMLAHRCFLHAAENGCTQAWPFVGSLFHFGRGENQRDLQEAKRWYEMALSSDDTSQSLKACAAHNLGLIFLRDEEEEGRDYLRALRYYELAEKYGHDCAEGRRVVAKLILGQTCVRNL